MAINGWDVGKDISVFITNTPSPYNSKNANDMTLIHVSIDDSKLTELIVNPEEETND